MVYDDSIGIEFEFTHDYVNHITRIFQNITVEKFTWYVYWSENYMPDGNGKIEQFLPNGVYSGQEFSLIINSSQEYYIHCIHLYAVPNGLDFDHASIKNYNDYKRSNAVIALLSEDSLVDFYTKDNNILKSVYEVCIKYYKYNSEIKPLKIKTIQNNSRDKF